MPSSYTQYTGPTVQEGNNPNGQTAIEWWAELFQGPNGNPAVNTLVDVELCGLYWLNSSTGQWTAATFNYPSGIGSDQFNPSYTVAYNNPIPLTVESDGTFALSTPGEVVTEMFSANRLSINPNEMGGIVAILAARLIVANPSLPDDRDIASFLLDTGADYYPSVTGPGIQNNPGVAGGKFKYVTVNWRSFAMTTMTAAQINSNPPPINLTGILP